MYSSSRFDVYPSDVIYRQLTLFPGMYENEKLNSPPPPCTCIEVLLDYTISIQATDDIQKHYDSAIVEPRLVVFTDNGKLSQMLICAEGEELFEAPGNTLIDGIVLLMAAYFVFKFDYPKQCKSLLFFFEDILMGRANETAPTKGRPIRYNSFMSRFSF